MEANPLLRRSLLFVPGGDSRKLERAPGAGADTIVVDLEDAVAPEAKERARAEVADWLRAASVDAERAVRVNPPGTPWFEADLAAVVAAGADAVMLPKCADAGALAQVAASLDESEQGGERSRAATQLLALLESARGVLDAAAVGGASPRVAALCFGHADFSLDMGLPAPDPAGEAVLHARCSVALAARAAGVAAVDTVYLDVRDEAGFRADAALGRRLGFEGKLCIHPAQVAIANATYTPTPDQVAQAQRVVTAWVAARAEGRSVFALDGKMVDGPVAALAERTLQRARQAGALGPS